MLHVQYRCGVHSMVYIYSVEVSLVEVWRCTCTNLLQIILQHIPSYYTYHTNDSLAIHYDA